MKKAKCYLRKLDFGWICWICGHIVHGSCWAEQIKNGKVKMKVQCPFCKTRKRIVLEVRNPRPDWSKRVADLAPELKKRRQERTIEVMGQKWVEVSPGAYRLQELRGLSSRIFK